MTNAPGDGSEGEGLKDHNEITTLEPSGDTWQLSALLRESAAVLAAILVAFGLDAWWDAFGEQRLLEDQVAAVEAELGAVLEEVDRTTLPIYLQQMERFLALEPEDVPVLPADTAARAIRQLGLWTFDAGISATRTLATSPVLADRRPDLVPVLMRVPQLIDDLSEDAMRVEQRRQRCVDRLAELGLYRSMWLIRRGRQEASDLDQYGVLLAQIEDAEYRSCIAALHDEREVYSTEVLAISEAVGVALTTLPR